MLFHCDILIVVIKWLGNKYISLRNRFQILLLITKTYSKIEKKIFLSDFF